jgi:PAS domain S-box-containing protein
MWVFDIETLAFLAVNDATLQRYGYSPSEFLGMTIQDIRPPEEIPTLSQHLKDLLRMPPGPSGGWKHRTKNGSIIEVEISSNPITFQGRAAVLVLANDITEKKKLEAQLLQSQKMDAIGQLAGGVAHDFNNLLGVITGHTELLLKDLGAQHPGLRRAEQIQRAADRAGGLTRQLLAFSRKQVLVPEVLDLNAVLEDTEKMLRRLIGEDVQLVTVFAPGLGLVKADPGQMEQVIVNLAVNARDAMPRGGKLIIETANVDLDGSFSRTHPEVRPGSYVMLAVSDTGHGMDTDTIPRIFEPFFTTKEVGKGTGLGLSTVFGIVKQSGGHIAVYSEVGQGTSFKVYLPRIERSGEMAAAGVARAEAPRAGSETILLVEDEEALRHLIREILEAGGYRVLPGGSPEEAVATAETHSGPLHLLLTDVVMPRMSGRQVADRVKASRPAVRVMYMSGYTDEAISHHGALEPGTHFMQKPFTADALLRKVREVLDA